MAGAPSAVQPNSRNPPEVLGRRGLSPRGMWELSFVALHCPFLHDSHPRLAPAHPLSESVKRWVCVPLVPAGAEGAKGTGPRGTSVASPQGGLGSCMTLPAQGDLPGVLVSFATSWGAPREPVFPFPYPAGACHPHTWVSDVPAGWDGVSGAHSQLCRMVTYVGLHVSLVPGLSPALSRPLPLCRPPWKSPVQAAPLLPHCSTRALAEVTVLTPCIGRRKKWRGGHLPRSTPVLWASLRAFLTMTLSSGC